MKTKNKPRRPLVRFRRCSVGWNHAGLYEWEAYIDEPKVILAVGGYSTRASAKRGMVRFLARIGAKASAVEFETASERRKKKKPIFRASENGGGA